MNNRIFFLAVIFPAALCIVTMQLPAQDKTKIIQAQRPGVIELVLPDILVEKAWITVKPWDSPDRMILTIHYVLFNNSTRPTKCCPTVEGKKGWKEHPAMNWLFNIAVFGRSLPRGRYFRLANGGRVGTLMKAMEKGTYRATQLVNKGSKWEFKIMADYGNWIREKNEDNNTKKINWPYRLPIKKQLKIEKK